MRNYRGFGFAAAPSQRANSRDQFHKRKRFGQVIIRAGVEALRHVR